MPETTKQLRYLLLQIRNRDDPMQPQEVRCFGRVLDCDVAQITVWDTLQSIPSDADLARHDCVLIGGSGEYSATSTDAWIEPILELMRELHATAKPTFASCWGFQAMSRAMGGSVVHDLPNAELGTHWLRLTEEGKSDPVFSSLGELFGGQMGHEDRVDLLPTGTVLLASTELVANQAYRFADKPIYCTQFHPELNRDDLMGRVNQYPQYIYRIAGMPPERFNEMLEETPQTEGLIARFVEHVFG